MILHLIIFMVSLWVMNFQLLKLVNRLLSMKMHQVIDQWEKSNFYNIKFLFVIVSLSNTINFGEVHLNESRQILFSITNHHQKDSIRFEWPEHPQCTFSPRIGHLHAGKYYHIKMKICSFVVVVVVFSPRLYKRYSSNI